MTQSSDVPQKWRQAHEKVIKGDRSPLEAIRAMCVNCVGWEDLPESVGQCSAKTCPLWQFRRGTYPAHRRRSVTDEQRARCAELGRQRSFQNAQTRAQRDEVGV